MSVTMTATDPAAFVQAQTILRARRLLGDGAGDEGHIRTIPRFGYHWAATVVETQLDMAPDAIAETYWHVLNQHRSAWSWEVEMRPWVETF